MSAARLLTMRPNTLSAFLLASSLLLSISTLACAPAAETEDDSAAAAVSTSHPFAATNDEQYRDLKYVTAVSPIASSDGLVVNVVEETVRKAAPNPIRVTLVVNGVAYPAGSMKQITKTVQTGPGELTTSGFVTRADGAVERATVVFRYRMNGGALVEPPRMYGLGESRALEAAGSDHPLYSRLIDVDHAEGLGVKVSLVTALASSAPDTRDYAVSWQRGRRILLRVDDLRADGDDAATAKEGRTYDLSALLWQVDEVKVHFTGGLRIKGQEYVPAAPGTLEMVRKPVEYGFDLHQASNGTFADAVTGSRL